MKITLNNIKVRDIVKNYADNGEEGVFGYDNRLNIRPPYQREFVYKDAQRDKVIETIRKGAPLNIMYWAERDGKYELLDGQQRTISICQYVNNDFSYEGKYFSNLFPEEQEQILEYQILIYVCSGADTELLDWFKTINIAGEKLTNQELRNSVFCGSWLSDAKRYFSKTGCAAYKVAGDYLNGTAIRQDYLETTLKWISRDQVEDYMGKHQHDRNAAELWCYFTNVIDWVNDVFKVKRAKFMKGVEWGYLYNEYGSLKLDSDAIEEEVKRLMIDDDVTNKKGIYSYVLDRDEKHLSLRKFTDAAKIAAYERQEGVCPVCCEHFEYGQMHGDHIIPWSKGGKTTADNCRMLCCDCNRKKSNI